MYEAQSAGIDWHVFFGQPAPKQPAAWTSGPKMLSTKEMKVVRGTTSTSTKLLSLNPNQWSNSHLNTWRVPTPDAWAPQRPATSRRLGLHTAKHQTHLHATSGRRCTHSCDQELPHACGVAAPHAGWLLHTLAPAQRAAAGISTDLRRAAHQQQPGAMRCAPTLARQIQVQQLAACTGAANMQHSMPLVSYNWCTACVVRCTWD